MDVKRSQRKHKIEEVAEKTCRAQVQDKRSPRLPKSRSVCRLMVPLYGSRVGRSFLSTHHAKWRTPTSVAKLEG